MKRLFIAKTFVPLCVSAALLIAFYVNDKLPTDVLIYVAFTYVVWIVAAWWNLEVPGAKNTTVKSADFDRKEKSALSEMSEVEKYYVRLLHGLDQAADVLSFSLGNALDTTRNMHAGVARAHELAKNTGLLATNAMMSASACGEVGRGFVSVSKDLVKISERSEKDLVRLENLLLSIIRVLDNANLVQANPSVHWLEAQLSGETGTAKLHELEELMIRLHGYQATLMEISEHYESTSQLDVRWLQLGEAIKRVINELNSSLHSLADSAEKFAKEMRILQISDKLCETQLLEIKEGLMKTEHIDKNFDEIAT